MYQVECRLNWNMNISGTYEDLPTLSAGQIPILFRCEKNVPSQNTKAILGILIKLHLLDQMRWINTKSIKCDNIEALVIELENQGIYPNYNVPLVKFGFFDREDAMVFKLRWGS